MEHQGLHFPAFMKCLFSVERPIISMVAALPCETQMGLQTGPVECLPEINVEDQGSSPGLEAFWPWVHSWGGTDCWL